MNNKICPECGKKFHNCSGCNNLYEYENIYCSLQCFRNSLTYLENKNKLIRLIVCSKKDFIKLKDLSDFFNKLSDNIIYLYDEDIKSIWES